MTLRDDFTNQQSQLSSCLCNYVRGLCGAFTEGSFVLAAVLLWSAHLRSGLAHLFSRRCAPLVLLWFRAALVSRSFALAPVLLLWSRRSSGLAAVLLLSRCPLSILCCCAAGVAQLRSGLVHVCSPAALVLRCSGLDAVLLASHSSLSMLCSCTAAASASQ